MAGVWPALSQSVTNIHTFAADGSDGAHPYTGLTLGVNGNLYGTTSQGGSSNAGTVFKVTTTGNLTTLVNCNSTNAASPSGLTLGPDGNFYGVSPYRGWAEGTVFKLTPAGAFTTYNLNIQSPLGFPSSALTVGADGNLYGVLGIDAGDRGGVYSITSNETFTSAALFNADSGFQPYGTLTLGPDGNLYGSATSSEIVMAGTIFRVLTNGSLQTIASNIFNAAFTPGPDGNFYGTTLGTVFKVTTNGTLTTLVSSNFSSGAFPFSAGLTLAPDGCFYGTTSRGGNTNLNTGLGFGSVFKLTTNGTLTTLASFDGLTGAAPESSLTLGSDGNFYGTTYGGGSVSNGTIFRLNLPPDFITGPVDQSTFIGRTITFNSQPFGTSPFAYQWLSNGIPIVDATNNSLTWSNISGLITNTQFQVLVTNAWGSITSSVAAVHILWRPTVFALAPGGNGQVAVQLGSYPNSTNRLWATTDLSLPMQVIATNVMDGNGQSQFQDTNTAGVPAKFYRLSLP